MTEFKEYPAVITAKGNLAASKFGGHRMKISVAFDNGFVTDVWGGGAKPIQLQELEALKSLNVGEAVVVVEKFKPDGQAVYYLSGSMYEHIQIQTPGPSGPSAPNQPSGPASPTNPSQQVHPASHPQPMQQTSPHEPPALPPSAPVPSGANAVRPVDNLDLLHAAATMTDSLRVWELAYFMAKQGITAAGLDILAHEAAVLSLAERLFTEATPWKLRNETFTVDSHTDMIHGQLREPMSHDRLLEALRKRAAQPKEIDESTLKSIKAMVVLALKKLFGGDEGRRKFGKYVFGKDSMTEWTHGELHSTVSWINTSRSVGYEISPVVLVEAQCLGRKLKWIK